jgi:hypothetical protein
MSRPYKLRLSDGTVLLVDQDGLSTWLVDNKAMVQAAGSQQWRPLREFLAEERAAAKRASARKSSLPEPPLVQPMPREDEAPISAASPPEDPLQVPSFMAEGPSVQVLAEEPGGAGPRSSPQLTEPAETPPIRFKALDDEAPPHPTVSSWLDSLELPSASERSPLQVLADDPAARPVGHARESSTPDDSLPIIPLKPLGDEPLARAVAEPATAGEDGGDAVATDAAQGERPRGASLRLLSGFGALLSRLLGPIARLQGGLPASPDGPYAERPSTADEGLTIHPPRPIDKERPPTQTKGSIRGRVSGWLDRRTAWVSGLAHRERQGPSRDAFGGSSAAHPADPVPSEPVKPPPATSELPVLPFADVDEESEAQDVEAEEGEGLVEIVWLWTRRLVLIAVLVTGGVLIALNWESWFPRAVLLGKVAVAEIDKHVRSLEEAGRRREALAAAAGQLPHLAPETIQLVLSTSPTGFLDPAEVFRIACEAADRGLPTLTPAEADELRALRRELLGTLSRAEQQRIRDYDAARARRATFAFEDRDALEPFARGARALPAESRERLQSLLGRATAAGLVPAAASAPQHPTDR